MFWLSNTCRLLHDLKQYSGDKVSKIFRLILMFRFLFQEWRGREGKEGKEGEGMRREGKGRQGKARGKGREGKEGEGKGNERKSKTMKYHYSIYLVSMQPFSSRLFKRTTHRNKMNIV